MDVSSRIPKHQEQPKMQIKAVTTKFRPLARPRPTLHLPGFRRTGDAYIVIEDVKEGSP